MASCHTSSDTRIFPHLHTQNGATIPFSRAWPGTATACVCERKGGGRCLQSPSPSPLSLHPLDAPPSWGPECLRRAEPTDQVRKHPWAACSAQPGSSRLRVPCSAGVDRSTATFPLGASQSQRQPPASWAPASWLRPTHPDGLLATVTALCCFFQTSKWAG